MEIDGHSFVVTGGASGLGLACAEMLVRGGARVTIVDLNEEQGANSVERLGEAARFEAADVTREDQLRKGVETAATHGGGLHGAICCAGIAIGERLVGKAGAHRQESFERVLAVNVVGTFNTLRLAAELMIPRTANDDGERGVLVTTASVAALDGQIGQAAYAASKGAVASMTLPIARELARHGIRCVSIAPGIFDTAMMAGMSDEVRASLVSQVPFPPRLGRAEEFAALVEQVLRNVMLNGSVIRLDGGLRMGAK